MIKQELYNHLCAKGEYYKSINPYISGKAVLIKHFPKAWVKIKEILGRKATVKDIYYFLQPNARTTCKHCGEPTDFYTLYAGHKMYCNLKCSNNSVDTKQLKISTCNRNYGVSNPSQATKIKKKKVRTSRSNYGTDYPMQNKQVMKSATQTRIERTGYAYALQSPEAQEKSKVTLLRRYGADHSMRSPLIKEKIRLSMQLRYGVDNASQSPVIKKRGRC